MSCEALVQDGWAHVIGRFYTPSKVLADPTDIDFYWYTPDASTTEITGHYTYGSDPEVVRESTGKYYVDLNTTIEGRWNFKWAAAGTVNATVEGTFNVGESAFVGRST